MTPRVIQARVLFRCHATCKQISIVDSTIGALSFFFLQIPSFVECVGRAKRTETVRFLFRRCSFMGSFDRRVSEA